MTIEYFVFTDPNATTTMRWESTDDALVADAWQPDTGQWVHDVELARYILFEPAEIRPITRAEAEQRVGAAIDDPASDVRVAPVQSDDPPTSVEADQ